MINANIHSIETFGTVDGPGIRLVVFLTGCPLRCQYCHNPDTWNNTFAKQMTAQEIIEKYQRYESYLTDGGITISGGEPMMQMPFLIELFKLAKKNNIHTCIDTSGYMFKENDEQLNELMKYTDLLLLDIKHIDDDKHKSLTKVSNQKILAFACWLSEKNIPVWIRHVLVPTITDDETDLYNLGKFIGKLKNVKNFELLPYHNLGVKKWEELGIDYPLSDIEPPSDEAIKQAKISIAKGIRDQRLINKYE